MANKVRVFGRHGSEYRKQISACLGDHPTAVCNVAVNYGLQGDKLFKFKKRNRKIFEMPVLNLMQYGNKFEQIKRAEYYHVLVPRSWQTVLNMGEVNVPTLIKPYYSLGGRDIHEYDAGAPLPATHYLQEKIVKRRYEIRVHAFAWVDPEKWIFQKRVHEDGEDQIAWNHHNGGKFVTIKNPHDPLHNRIRESVKVMMKALGYQFGGADFIIANPGVRGEQLKHYFIEWNLAVGWTLATIEKYYKESFLMLQDMKMDKITAMIDGIYPWEEEEEDLPPAPNQGIDWDRVVDDAHQGIAHDNIPPFHIIDRGLDLREHPEEFEEDEEPWEDEELEDIDIEDPFHADPDREIRVEAQVMRVPGELFEQAIRPRERFPRRRIDFCPNCGDRRIRVGGRFYHYCHHCGLNFNPEVQPVNPEIQGG